MQIWHEICQHTKIVTISPFSNFMTKHPIQTLGINLSWNNSNNSLTPNLSLEETQYLQLVFPETLTQNTPNLLHGK